MSRFRPLRALRFAEAPPEIPRTDTLTAEALNALRETGHPLVTLAHPAGKRSDRSKFVRFARSAALQAQWRREGVLVPDAEATDEVIGVLADDELVIPAAETPAPLEERKRMWEATQTLYEIPIAVGSRNGIIRIVRGHLDARAIVETARRAPYVPVLLLDREPEVWPAGPIVAMEDQR